MPTPEEQGTVYGNIHSYKLNTRPIAQKLYGDVSFRKQPCPKHHENVQRLLEILAVNGTLTTWGMAKTHLSNTENIRSQEREYRRLLVGRMSRGKQLPGLLEIGLIVKDGKSLLKAPADQYRLSLHGVLYVLDVLDLSNSQIDTMAEKYASVLPMVFGKWNFLKNILGDEVYGLKILAGGLFMDNIEISNVTKFPVYELMTYLNIKYQNNFEQINEEDLANQISYWFYTTLLVPSTTIYSKKKTQVALKNWRSLFHKDRELKKWYNDFVDDAIGFYNRRLKTMKRLETKL